MPDPANVRHESDLGEVAQMAEPKARIIPGRGREIGFKIAVEDKQQLEPALGI